MRHRPPRDEKREPERRSTADDQGEETIKERVSTLEHAIEQGRLERVVVGRARDRDVDVVTRWEDVHKFHRHILRNFFVKLGAADPANSGSVRAWA